MAEGGGDGSSAPTGDRREQVGRRFLPVAAAVLPPLVHGDEAASVLPVAPGTPVHAVAAGRVLAAEPTVGEVVLRLADDLRMTYRRLLPSSMTLRAGDRVEAGDLLGVVGQPAGGGIATLELTSRQADGAPVAVGDLLVGGSDPLELLLTPPATVTTTTPSRKSQPRPTATSTPAQKTGAAERDDTGAATPSGQGAAAALSLQGRPRPRRGPSS